MALCPPKKKLKKKKVFLENLPPPISSQQFIPSSNPHSHSNRTGCGESNTPERWIYTLGHGCLQWVPPCQLGCWNVCFYLHHVDKPLLKKNMGAAMHIFWDGNWTWANCWEKKTRTLSMMHDTFREFTKKVVQIMLTSWRPKASIQNTECVLSSTISDFPVNPFFRPATVLDTNTTNHSNPNRKLLTVCHLPPEKSLVFKYWHVWHDEWQDPVFGSPDLLWPRGPVVL